MVSMWVLNIQSEMEARVSCLNTELERLEERQYEILDTIASLNGKLHAIQVTLSACVDWEASQ